MNKQKDSVSEGVSEAVPEQQPRCFLVEHPLPGGGKWMEVFGQEENAQGYAKDRETELHVTATVTPLYARVHQPELNLEDKKSVSGASELGDPHPGYDCGGTCVVCKEGLREIRQKASGLSTDRVSQDIQLTLAEIRERGERRRFEVSSYSRLQDSRQALQDIDTLLSIIDTLQHQESVK